MTADDGRGAGGASITEFNLYGPLPEGTTVLEASAGTGKTFAIATLAVRHLAVGVPADALLIVTFTRAATGELRDRVRDRLVSAIHGLRIVSEGADAPDELVRLLSSEGHARTALHLERLSRAAAAFDTATITTTHGFCGLVLGGLGTAGDLGTGWQLVESIDDLTDEVVDDLYLRHYVRPRAGHDVTITRAQAGRAARSAVGNPRTVLAPANAERDTPANLLFRLASRAGEEVGERLARSGTLGYDDLLTRLCGTLEDPLRGPAAARRLRERYRVVLVDEFQDTDPVQWEIIRRAFDGTVNLVLIGDPKQAIYAFRGGDVHAYLAACRSASTRATLAVNWRSDQGLVNVLGALWNGVALGHPAILVRAVRAAPDHQSSGLVDPARPEPLRLRLLRRGDHPRLLNAKSRTFKMDRALAAVAEDLAADVQSSLAAGTTLRSPPHGGAAGRLLLPQDIAVLVDRNDEAEVMHAALLARGVPAVIAGSGPVVATDAARHWLTLLAALELPSSGRRARAAALTPFIGWTAQRLSEAGDAHLDELTTRLQRWADVANRRGVAVLTETIMATEDLPARLLQRVDGERHLTDLRHMAEILHGHSSEAQLGISALTTWLRHRIADPTVDIGGNRGWRRLDSDADAVQVLTVHRSKGLEFPIVYLPCMWRVRSLQQADILAFHDPDNGDRRTVDVGGDGGPGRAERFHQAGEEQDGEDLRKAYVALTRARHQVVVWWLAAQNTHKAAFSRLVQRSSGARTPKVTDDGFELAIEARFEAVRHLIDVTTVTTTGRQTTVASDVEEEVELTVRSFDRALDTVWQRTSYTGLTRHAHGSVAADPVVGEETGPQGPDDEWLPTTADLGARNRSLHDCQPPDGVRVGGSPSGNRSGGDGGGSGELPSDDGSTDEDERALRGVASPMATLPGGASFGTVVHAVLEATDFTVPDLSAEISSRVAGRLTGDLTQPLDTVTLVAALVDAIETPLGPAASGIRLRDLDRTDRLDEVSFELPLVGGERASGQVTVAAMAALLRRSVPAGAPLGSYADRLDDPLLATSLRGYLTGSIDAVVRLPAAATGRRPRFTIIDYKTNWLGVGDEPLSAWHYRPSALLDAMQRAHYPLQALLYLTALHRFLRWRLPGYDPDIDLGPVLYLFLRGMTGGQVPFVGGTPCGVFTWVPPRGLVSELSDLLDRGVSTAAMADRR
ncbi:MAG: UvrD-helicase domain-containing protein [Actinomycetota bacterium]|nr:UvrD-helicase domain-containing protein [Actinomycetota bacterium]